jgi:crossover junction endodeoxyribonuclease RuvC
MATIVLGIDPGSRNTGVAVMRKDGSRFTLLHSGVIKVGNLELHIDRLPVIYREVTDLILQYKPDSCAIETPLYGKDPLALLKLGRAQAAAILAAVNLNIRIEEYYPKMVKKSITGNGNATKDQVAYMLDKILSLNGEKLSADATDAMAVAWCHLSRDTADHKTQIQTGKKSHQNNAKSDWSKFVAGNPDRIR